MPGSPLKVSAGLDSGAASLACSDLITNGMDTEDKQEHIGNEYAITGLLMDWRNGDQSAFERLASLVYDELYRIAQRQMRRERQGHTLQPSALVNEAFMRLIDYDQVNWQSRQHFFRLAAKMMREVLVNYAASRKSLKRGGDARRLTLEKALARDEKRPLELDEMLALNEALERLGLEDERSASVVELMFFGGLSEKETADELGVSERTVKREWRYARLWLRRELSSQV
jgi:RNA polymerase sigma factor (TIGR02999 family)